MHRIALKHRGVISGGKANGLKGWSILSRPCLQRVLSNGPDSTKDGDQDSSAENCPSKDGRGAGEKPGMGGAAGEGNTPPAGRGRGAFSQFLRTHERQIGKHINKIDKRASSPPSRRGRRGDPVRGQFDDSEDSSAKKSFVGSAREKHLTEKGEGSQSSPLNEDWQEKWFAHEDKRIDQLANVGEEERGDMPELDDCDTTSKKKKKKMLTNAVAVAGRRSMMALSASSSVRFHSNVVGLNIPDSYTPREIDAALGRSAPERRPTEEELKRIEETQSVIYSLQSSDEEIKEAISKFVESGDYDLLRSEHSHRLEALGEEINTLNLALNEQHEHDTDPRSGDGHFHPYHPQVGAFKGSLFPMPDGKISAAVGLWAAWILPAIVAVGAVKYAMWKA